MTNQDTTTDPVPLPVIPSFPLAKLRAKLESLPPEELAKLIVRSAEIRRKLDVAPAAGQEIAYGQVVSACNLVQEVLAAKQTAPPADQPGGIAQGKAFITELSGP